jgi:hypothetical protein
MNTPSMKKQASGGLSSIRRAVGIAEHLPFYLFSQWVPPLYRRDRVNLGQTQPGHPERTLAKAAACAQIDRYDART